MCPEISLIQIRIPRLAIRCFTLLSKTRTTSNSALPNRIFFESEQLRGFTASLGWAQQLQQQGNDDGTSVANRSNLAKYSGKPVSAHTLASLVVTFLSGTDGQPSLFSDASVAYVSAKTIYRESICLDRVSVETFVLYTIRRNSPRPRRWQRQLPMKRGK